MISLHEWYHACKVYIVGKNVANIYLPLIYFYLTIFPSCSCFSPSPSNPNGARFGCSDSPSKVWLCCSLTMVNHWSHTSISSNTHSYKSKTSYINENFSSERKGRRESIYNQNCLIIIDVDIYNQCLYITTAPCANVGMTCKLRYNVYISKILNINEMFPIILPSLLHPHKHLPITFGPKIQSKRSPNLLGDIWLESLHDIRYHGQAWSNKFSKNLFHYPHIFIFK